MEWDKLMGWSIDIHFNEDDIKNQLPEDLYSYLVDCDLMDEFAELVIFATKYDINENFSEVVGANMVWVAQELQERRNNEI